MLVRLLIALPCPCLVHAIWWGRRSRILSHRSLEHRSTCRDKFVKVTISRRTAGSRAGTLNQDGYLHKTSVRSDIVSGHIELTNFSNLAHT